MRAFFYQLHVKIWTEMNGTAKRSNNNNTNNTDKTIIAFSFFFFFSKKKKGKKYFLFQKDFGEFQVCSLSASIRNENKTNTALSMPILWHCSICLKVCTMHVEHEQITCVRIIFNLFTMYLFKKRNRCAYEIIFDLVTFPLIGNRCGKCFVF